MTTFTAETMNYPAETDSFTHTERPTQLLARIGTFVIDRFTLSGDHQMGKVTATPVFFHESHNAETSNVVLGEE